MRNNDHPVNCWVDDLDIIGRGVPDVAEVSSEIRNGKSVNIVEVPPVYEDVIRDIKPKRLSER